MGGVCHRPLYYIGDIYDCTQKRKPLLLVNDGYEVLKNSFGGDKIVKQEAKKAEPKKKMFAKKKK